MDLDKIIDLDKMLKEVAQQWGRNTYGGDIRPSDYCNEYKSTNAENVQTRSLIADRIVADLAFDEQCRKNIESRKIFGGFKGW